MRSATPAAFPGTVARPWPSLAAWGLPFRELACGCVSRMLYLPENPAGRGGDDLHTRDFGYKTSLTYSSVALCVCVSSDVCTSTMRIKPLQLHSLGLLLCSHTLFLPLTPGIR